MFNYEYIKINFNMRIKIFCRLSPSLNFIKIKQNKTIYDYFQLQEPSSYK